MYYWTTEALIDAARERLVKEEAGDKLPKFDAGRWEELLRDFLERVYHGMRNQGLAPQDRAVNHAATDVFQAGKAIATVLRLHKEAELERVRVRPCSISHAHSCCCEIELSFSNVSKRSATLRRAYRYMIDASDVVPVTVGAIRSWSE
jgi:hypothetical protein